MRRIVTLAVGLVVCAALSACGSSRPVSSSASLSPSSRATKSIVSAALAQKSVHWTEYAVAHMSGSDHWTSNVTADSGEQWGTLNISPTVGGRVHILLVDSTVYIEGNPAGLRSQLKLTRAQANNYAWQWIAIPKGDKLYGVSGGLTLGSIVHAAIPHGNLKIVRKVLHGKRRLVLQAKDTGEPFPRLSARGTGAPLPIAFVDAGCLGCGSGITFSKWNEPVRVHPPAHSVPIATVRNS